MVENLKKKCCFIVGRTEATYGNVVHIGRASADCALVDEILEIGSEGCSIIE